MKKMTNVFVVKDISTQGSLLIEAGIQIRFVIVTWGYFKSPCLGTLISIMLLR